MKTLWTILLVLLATAAQAQSLTVTTLASPATIKTGATSTITATLKNTNAASSPVVFTATAEWEDEYGIAQSTTATTSVKIVKPVKPKAYKWGIPALFEYSGHCQVDGVAVTPTVAGSEVTIPLTRTLNEGESTVITFGVKAK